MATIGTGKGIGELPAALTVAENVAIAMGKDPIRPITPREREVKNEEAQITSTLTPTSMSRSVNF